MGSLSNAQSLGERATDYAARVLRVRSREMFHSCRDVREIVCKFINMRSTCVVNRLSWDDIVGRVAYVTVFVCGPQYRKQTDKPQYVTQYSSLRKY